MGGGERGRRNTGYWAPFNVWWRAHLERHGERPKAEDLKRWFNEESRHAFPNEPPTYTMIRNHAKGLRDIASVKHYFRDYRARKRRAVADLAGEPSPRSEPDIEEEEERDSGSMAASSESGCSSDEDWKEEARRGSSGNRDRRRKRPAAKLSSQQEKAQQQQAQAQDAQAQAAGQQQSPPRQEPAQMVQHQHLQGLSSPFGLQMMHSQQQEQGLDESGDLTVTVTVNQPPVKHEPQSCVPETDPLCRPSPCTTHKSPPQPRLDIDDPAGHFMSSASAVTPSSLLPNCRASSPGAARVGSGVPSAAAPDLAMEAAWRPLGPLHEDGPGGLFHPGLTHSTPADCSPLLLTGLTSSAPLESRSISCSPRPMDTRFASRLGEQGLGFGHYGSLPVEPQHLPPPPSHTYRGTQAPGAGQAPARARRGAGSAVAAAAASVSAAAATGAGALATGQLQSAATTHLSPMSSQPVPPADAASTASTEAQRAGKLAAADAGGVNGSGAAVAAAARRASCGPLAVGPPEALPSPPTAAVAVGPGSGQGGRTGSQTLAVREELYVGLHGAGASVECGEGLLASMPTARLPSGSSGGGSVAASQAWTPFAIPVAQVVEAEARQQHNANSRNGSDSGGGSQAGLARERGSSVSMYGQWTLAGAHGSVPPPSADDAGGPGAGPGVQRSHASAPCLEDSGLAAQASWLHRSSHHQHLKSHTERQGSAPLAGRMSDYFDSFGHPPLPLQQQQQVGPCILTSALDGGAECGIMMMPGRQTSAPTLPQSDPAGCGTYGYGSGPAAAASMPVESAQLPANASASLAVGPPPITTGFAPSKNAVRPGAVTTCASAVAAGAAAGGGCGGLQAASPPITSSAHVVLTGANTPHSAAAVTVAAVAAAGGGGLQPTSSLGVATSLPPIQDAAGCGVAMPINSTPRSGSLPAPSSSPVRGFTAGSGFPAGRPVQPGLVTPSGSCPTPSTAAWSPLPPRIKSATAALPPFPPHFTTSPSAPAPLPASPMQHSHGGVALASSGSGGVPGGPACAPSSAPSVPPRVRWIPYPHAMTHGRMPPPPNGWHPYPYPPVPAYPGCGVRGVPGPYPGQYLPYVVRRRYPPPQYGQQLQPAVPAQQQQQHPSQLTPSSRLAPSGAVAALPAGWPAGGRPPQSQASRALAFGLLGQDPWVTVGYEDLRPSGPATAAAARPSAGDMAKYVPEQHCLPSHSMASAPEAAMSLPPTGLMEAPPPPHLAVTAPLPASSSQATVLTGAAGGSLPGSDMALSAADCIMESMWDDDSIGSILFSGGEFGGSGPLGGAALSMPGAQGVVPRPPHQFAPQGVDVQQQGLVCCFGSQDALGCGMEPLGLQ